MIACRAPGQVDWDLGDREIGVEVKVERRAGVGSDVEVLASQATESRIGTELRLVQTNTVHGEEVYGRGSHAVAAVIADEDRVAVGAFVVRARIGAVSNEDKRAAAGNRVDGVEVNRSLDEDVFDTTGCIVECRAAGAGRTKVGAEVNIVGDVVGVRSEIQAAVCATTCADAAT